MRMSGGQLASYLKSVLDIGSTIGGKVAGAVGRSSRLATIGAGTAEEAAQALQTLPLGKYVSQLPIGIPVYQSLARNAPQIAGVAANVATQAAVPYLTSYLLKGLTSGAEPFAERQYSPGSLPLTNYQAGQSYLNQQRYNQQLSLAQNQYMADRYNQQDRLALLMAKQPQDSGIGYTPLSSNPVANLSRGLQQTYTY